jgi:Transport and Golgi organisation 2
VLALRDEVVGRDFDDPDRWWPEYPEVIGGRDRTAGGTWCATRRDTGTTALVLNRPQKRTADPGAASRGVLPLLALAHGEDWPGHVRLAGMASFLLVLVTPERLVTWDFDGANVQVTEQAPGTVMITSGGPEDRKAERHLSRFRDAAFPDGWRALVEAESPSEDPADLVILREQDGAVFATVFGQLIQAEPGRLHLEWSRQPWRQGTWSSPCT